MSGMVDNAIDYVCPCWREFGKSADGRIDIADPDGDVLCCVPPDAGEQILQARERFVREMEGIFADLIDKGLNVHDMTAPSWRRRMNARGERVRP